MARTRALEQSAPLQLASRALETVQPVGAVDVELMLWHLMRCQRLMIQYHAEISPDHFYPDEAIYQVLWEVVSDQYTRYKTFSDQTLRATVQKLSETDSERLMPEDWQLLLNPTSDGIISGAMMQPAEQFIEGYGEEIIHRFLHERAVVTPLRIILQTGGNGYVKDFSGVIDSITRTSRRLEALGDDPVVEVMPDRNGLVITPITFHSTGIEFIDSAIRGQRDGDVIGMLGPFGSGKTTVLCDLAVKNGKRLYCEAMSAGVRPMIAFMISYEEPEEKVKYKMWANAAHIPYSRLTCISDFGRELSTRDNLQPYEQQEFAIRMQVGGEPDSEADRWDEACNWTRQSLRLIDMSGSGKCPNAGCNGVDEIVASIERKLNERNAECGWVGIDYAGLACKRFMDQRGISPDNLRHFLGTYGDQVRRKIAEHFGCPVWVNHQFNADANRKSPGQLLHHSDAAEATNFAENMAVCGCLGTVDQITGCLRINWSKLRYKEQVSNPPIVKIEGEYSRVIDVSERFQLDPVTKRFVDTHEMSQIHGAAPKRKSARGPITDLGFAT